MTKEIEERIDALEAVADFLLKIGGENDQPVIRKMRLELQNRLAEKPSPLFFGRQFDETLVGKVVETEECDYDKVTGFYKGGDRSYTGHWRKTPHAVTASGNRISVLGQNLEEIVIIAVHDRKPLKITAADVGRRIMRKDGEIFFLEKKYGTDSHKWPFCVDGYAYNCDAEPMSGEELKCFVEVKEVE